MTRALLVLVVVVSAACRPDLPFGAPCTVDADCSDGKVCNHSTRACLYPQLCDGKLCGDDDGRGGKCQVCPAANMVCLRKTDAKGIMRGNGPAMTLDEVVVLDRALSGEEIQTYLTAVKALAQVKFPVGQAANYQKP